LSFNTTFTSFFNKYYKVYSEIHFVLLNEYGNRIIINTIDYYPLHYEGGKNQSTYHGKEYKEYISKKGSVSWLKNTLLIYGLMRKSITN